MFLITGPWQQLLHQLCEVTSQEKVLQCQVSGHENVFMLSDSVKVVGLRGKAGIISHRDAKMETDSETVLNSSSWCFDSAQQDKHVCSTFIDSLSLFSHYREPAAYPCDLMIFTVLSNVYVGECGRRSIGRRIKLHTRTQELWRTTLSNIRSYNRPVQ